MVRIVEIRPRIVGRVAAANLEAGSVLQDPVQGFFTTASRPQDRLRSRAPGTSAWAAFPGTAAYGDVISKSVSDETGFSRGDFVPLRREHGLRRSRIVEYQRERQLT